MEKRSPIGPVLAGVALAASFGLPIAALSPALAADASRWDQDLRSAARLIAASAPARSAKSEDPLRAAIEIKLQPGWKTYWRYPGDSGVPPQFDFSKSSNVKDVAVRWPAPQRFDDGAGGQSIGYKGDVVLPLHVVPADPSKPVTLRMRLEYGVCEKLCVPAKAEAEMTMTGGPSAHDARVTAAEARVPVARAMGSSGSLSIVAVRREVAGDKPRIVVDVAAPAGQMVDLFAEGPASDWALPLPEVVKNAPADVRRFSFALDGLPPGGKPDGALLRLTAVAGEAAVETGFRLD